MTTIELTRKILRRLGKLKLIVILLGIGSGVALYLYGKQIAAIYTVKSSVFPLTAANESSAASSLISSLTGAGEAPKSFSQEASINIIELATSRTTREAVAMEKVPELANKTIAQLLIESNNKNKAFLAKDITMPKNENDLKAVGAEIIKGGMGAKINKNGILELTFSNADKNIISPISYALIGKISQFYIDLKVKKAKVDFDFTVRKMDSLKGVLDGYDRKAVQLANTTLFVPEEKIEYTIPKENLISAKNRVVRQFDASANNKEESLWRLQKATPIIEILDRPEAPYDIKKPSATLYAMIGFILGCVIGIVLCVSDILYKYLNAEINSAVFGDEGAVAQAEAEQNTSTPAVS